MREDEIERILDGINNKTKERLEKELKTKMIRNINKEDFLDLSGWLSSKIIKDYGTSSVIPMLTLCTELALMLFDIDDDDFKKVMERKVKRINYEN